jgi:hypothetical protein
MVFWDTYPIWNIFQAKINKDAFKSLVFNREPIESPTGVEAIIVKHNENEKYLNDISGFLKTNFGNPPRTPILNIPPEKLLNKKDIIIIVLDIDKKIIGCVRYHYLGIFANDLAPLIYCVDCFCVNKKWRRRGVGDYLLTTLHIFVNRNNIPYSFFLKEGSRVSTINSPLYTSRYVFKKLESMEKSKNVQELTVNQAYALMDIMNELNPTIVIRNIEQKNQFWKLYKNGNYKVLVCFQDTYQEFKECEKMNKMCWATGWFESSNMTDSYREEASKELSALMFPEFDYVWMDKMWVGNGEGWKDDGPFHWYSYQWTSSVNIKRSYCILN